MLPYPQIEPEIVRIGPLAVRWYGVMYLLGFASAYLLVRYQVRKKSLSLPRDWIESLFSYIILGLLIGARLGYVIFYNLSYYLQHPLETFAVWQGGMSFHGGLIGCFVAGVLFYRKVRTNFWVLSDLVIVTAPIGLAFGRLGNFINGELYGRVTDVPWGMVFPAGGPLPRHPSQLYELFLEGLVLFTVLWIAKDKVRQPGVLTSFFLILYGVFRLFVEFFREPDAHLGFVAGAFTMGQVLSGLMVAAGLLLLVVVTKGRRAA